MYLSKFCCVKRKKLKITQWIQARFEKLDFLLRPYMKYFQLNVNLFLYYHRLTPHTCFFRSDSKTLKTLYLTSVKGQYVVVISSAPQLGRKACAIHNGTLLTFALSRTYVKSESTCAGLMTTVRPNKLWNRKTTVPLKLCFLKS